MRKSDLNKAKKPILIISIFVIVIFCILIGFFTYLFAKYDLNKAKLTSLNNGIKVYSYSGNDSTLHNTNRSIIELKELPQYVKDAFISVEDKNFYNHKGYDIKRIIKSCLVNITTKSKSQGASTISQQLIKNALLSNEKTYSRKIQEIVLAIKMEKDFSKDEILQMYLNTIYFGSNAYGIENASKIYFNKSAKDLTLNEACCLAGLIKSPAYYSPITHYDNAIKRKNLVAKLMYQNKKMTKPQYIEIKQTDIDVSIQSDDDNSYEKEAIFEACRLLNITERELINNKYEIITFKQDDLQNKVAEINKNLIAETEKLEQTDLDSLSIVANNKGQVLAYYANSNYNLHKMTRQPASTLKPLAVYLPCFEYNILSPASLILDEEINYNGFSPKNADKKYHGYISTREALAHSLNIPAVKALDYLGVKRSKETLANLGINISNSDLNLSLALGAVKNGVDLVDLLAAYMVMANQGIYNNMCFVSKILDENGHIIYSHEEYPIKVYNSESCYLVNDILKDCAKTGTASKLASLNLPIASKTGTASIDSGNTDLFNISYSTEHTMLTWIASIKDNILPKNLLSSSHPTKINKDIIAYLYEKNAPKDFSMPEGVVKSEYDLVELESEHILCKPNHNKERYVAYDYFKLDNLPQVTEFSNKANMQVEVSKVGANISFEGKKYNNYHVIKNTDKGKFTISTIKEKNGIVSVIDHDIFSYNLIEYYLEDDFGNIISNSIKIRPKDYLINYFNDISLSNKRKWQVSITPL